MGERGFPELGRGDGTTGHQKESPESLAGGFGAEGIEALPKRVDRYGKAKKGALDVAEFIEAHVERSEKLHQRLSECGTTSPSGTLHHRQSEVA
jgi:hypothetical protein